nr:GGDEF domain-containing protein [Rhodanobacter sp. DHB23]
MYNETVQAELRRLARTDPLTGTLNRLALDEESLRLFRAADRPNTLAALIIDVDHFKRINDNFGHVAGDRVLAALAAGIRWRLQPPAVLGRMGGEEFLVLLPDTGVAEAIALAERLRAAIAAMPSVPDAGIAGVTASIGIAAYRSGDASVDDLIQRADRALYDAKRAGRNRVVAAVGDASPVQADPMASPAPSSVPEGR